MLGNYYDLENDSKFKEFISLHSKKDKRKMWNNELAEQAGEMKPKVTSHIESVEAKQPGGKGLYRSHLKFEESELESVEPENDQSVESRPKLSDVDYLRLSKDWMMIKQALEKIKITQALWKIM